MFKCSVASIPNDKELVAIFNEIDSDKSGNISRDEMAVHIKKQLGISDEEASLELVMNHDSSDCAYEKNTVDDSDNTKNEVDQ